MIKTVEAIFWLSALVIFYTYIGYPLLLQLFFRRRRLKAQDYFPKVTIVVPVYNEEKFVEVKIRNCLSLRYPGSVKFLFVNDASTDETVHIISRFPDVELISLEKRSGKSAALNKAMERVETDLVIFTDANCLLHEDCLNQLAPYFADEKVGGVSGEKKIFSAGNDNAVSGAEKLYWQYESFLKKAEASFYSVVGADGGLFAMRSELFSPLSNDVILDDFFISSRICEQGYKFLYEPRAFAIETASTSVEEEQKRKVRISAGCFQALFRLRRLLNPLGHLRLFIVYLSHRVLRWVACPLLLPLLLAANALLLTGSNNRFYSSSFALQGIFYLLATIAWIIPNSRRWQLFMVPYYFLFMNVSIFRGFFRYIKKNQSANWEKTDRQPFPERG